ncbi:MAG: Gfo/Idh/MocA family oxidoreductase [Chloroflexi bacterium]|nr:Gfo/Idh/MocA family oxidoreductase [Chloroflexota bacterium]
MKVLMIGAGSMGRRRLRDLIALNVGEVLLYEPQVDRCQEVAQRYGIQGFSDLEEALSQHPQVMVVSTPPALHGLYVAKALEHRLHVFCEVPFALDLELLRTINTQLDSYPGVLGISHTLRYYPPFRIIHDLIHQDSLGKPLYIEYSLGSYLPDWHPYENYRKFYASDMKLGGAGMDMLLHELAAIQWWMGDVQSVYARFSKLSTLEIAGPDNQDILLSFGNGARGFFHHDLIEQGTVGRHVRIVGSSGTVEWHQNLPEVRFFNGTDRVTRNIPFADAADWAEALSASKEMADNLAKSPAYSQQMNLASQPQYTYESNYLRELRHFLEAAQGAHPFTMTNLGEELQNVRVFHAILRSAQEGHEVRVTDQTYRESLDA